MCLLSPFHSNEVISLFSKSKHISYHLLYSLLLYFLFISLSFSFPTFSFLYLTHLTQFFLISVPKRNASTTMERRKYVVLHKVIQASKLNLTFKFTLWLLLNLRSFIHFFGIMHVHVPRLLILSLTRILLIYL